MSVARSAALVPTRRPRTLRLPGPGTVGGAVLAVFGLVALAAPSLAPYRHTELAGSSLVAPGSEHLLGTNSVGQDLFSQLILGARLSLTIALLAGLGTLAIGAAVGLSAGWLGGRTDAALMRVVDLTLAIPRLPLLIVVGAYAGPSVLTIAVIIAVTSWPAGARVVRSQVLSLRGRNHLRAAVGFGASGRQVLRRHVVPEVGLILAAGLVGAAGRAVTIEAGLAFLGLGDPTHASWGKTLRGALDFGGLFYTDAWTWWLLPPLAAISALLLGLTLLGMSIEERVNPRLSRHTRPRRNTS